MSVVFDEVIATIEAPSPQVEQAEKSAASAETESGPANIEGTVTRCIDAEKRRARRLRAD